MSTAALDRLLAGLLVAQLASGLLSLRSGTPPTAPVFWLHGVVGGALLVASVEKVRRSLGPAIRAGRWRRLAIGLLLTLLAAGALVLGVAWIASGRILSLGPWTVLTIHVWFGLAAVPVVLVHLLPHRWRLLRPRTRASGPLVSRRTLLGSAAILGLGALTWGAANLLDRLQDGARRFTGSRWLQAGGVPPPTTFYGEGAPAVDPSAWRLRVVGRVATPLTLDTGGLAAVGTDERDATLDCTSGWVMTTRWRGTPLRAVLEAAGADARAPFVRIRSVTGWMVALEHEDLDTALLATHVAGEPLPTANGAPLRLVAPRRRGLDWVKWVDEIEVG
jgi:DMSO/TMAO reductase YedYZ molybdopterin-dependent catalytic subunit